MGVGHNKINGIGNAPRAPSIGAPLLAHPTVFCASGVVLPATLRSCWVRLYMRGGGQVDLERPAVDGDELVAPGGFSMLLADILSLGVRGFSLVRTILAGFGLYTAVIVLVYAYAFGIEGFGSSN